MTNASIRPLKLTSTLSPTPQSQPKYKISVKGRKGEEVFLGDPAVTRALVAIMDSYAVNGGAASHWGGPAAFAEIMSAIHGLMFGEAQRQNRPWHELYNFVNDAGHTENGLYALRANLGYGNLTFKDLWGFRGLHSPLTGHGEAHVFPGGVLLSNGPLSSAFPQAQGLALADKTIGNSRVTICTISDGACMEGEAREAFASIPGLALKGKLNPFVLVLSDNNTKLSGRIDADSFNLTPTFKAMGELGWKVFYCHQGNDLQKVFSVLEEAFEEAKNNPLAPVFVHFKTIKGYGVKSTEESKSGGHGFPLKKHDPKIAEFVSEIFKGEIPREFQQFIQELLKPIENIAKEGSKAAVSKPEETEVKKEKAQAGLSRGAERAAQEGFPVFSVSSDLQGSTGIEPFQKKFPDRYIDIGVAEANMVSVAAGLSKCGLIPIVDTFAQFGVTKGNLPLTMANLSMAPVIGIFSHTGLQDAADGASHQATTYLAATSSIPHVDVVCCSCSEEAEAFMYQAITQTAMARERGEIGNSILFFVGRENFPSTFQKDYSYQWGKAQVIHTPSQADFVLVASGPMVERALKVLPFLQQSGLHPLIINNPFINRPDIPTIADALKKAHGRLLTLEDHQVIGGMGAQLCHALKQNGVPFTLTSLGIKGHFGRSAYTAEQLYDQFGLSAEAILQAARNLIEKT